MDRSGLGTRNDLLGRLVEGRSGPASGWTRGEILGFRATAAGGRSGDDRESDQQRPVLCFFEYPRPARPLEGRPRKLRPSRRSRRSCVTARRSNGLPRGNAGGRSKMPRPGPFRLASVAPANDRLPPTAILAVFRMPTASTTTRDPKPATWAFGHGHPTPAWAHRSPASKPRIALNDLLTRFPRFLPGRAMNRGKPRKALSVYGPVAALPIPLHTPA